MKDNFEIVLAMFHGFDFGLPERCERQTNIPLKLLRNNYSTKRLPVKTTMNTKANIEIAIVGSKQSNIKNSIVSIY